MSDSVKVPDGWKEYRVNNLLDLLTDFEANGSFATVKENVTVFDSVNHAWYVRATDLENNSPLGQVKYVDEHSYTFLTKTSLVGGELLIMKRGEIGKIYYFRPPKCYATLAPNLYLLKLNNNVESKYLYYYFVADIGNRKLTQINASTTIGALYKDDVKRLLVSLPPLPEQKKIASILTSVDDVIEKTEAQISKLQDLKKGMMTELLTKGIGHTEFKDSPVGRIPVGWGVSTIGNFVTDYKGGGIIVTD